MLYIHTFERKSEQVAYYNGADYKEPCLSYEKKTKDVMYNKEKSPTQKGYLTLIAIEDGTFSFSNDCMYSLDGGDNWVELNAGANTPSVASGESVMFKAEFNQDPNNDKYACGIFSSTGRFNASGNPYSMFSGDSFDNVTAVPERVLESMFLDSRIVSAKYLALPATTLGAGCYGSMFYNCASLIELPELPASELADYCYEAMFAGCTSLTDTPSLSAQNLAKGCYRYMFNLCTNLTGVTSLPASTLSDSCYEGMFAECGSITSTPRLSASVLAKSCYQGMFSGCTSITSITPLDATTLPDKCYTSMFDGCTSLASVMRTLPATVLSNYCYASMFKGCTSLTASPELNASVLQSSCYMSMFSGCSALEMVTMKATDVTATNCLNNFMSNVGSSGRIYMYQTIYVEIMEKQEMEGIEMIPITWELMPL